VYAVSCFNLQSAVCAAYSAAITRKRIRLFGKSCPSDDGTYQALDTFVRNFSVDVFSIFRDMCRLVFVNKFAVLIFLEFRQQEEFRFCGSDLRALPLRILPPSSAGWTGALSRPTFVVAFAFALGRDCVVATVNCALCIYNYALCIKKRGVFQLPSDNQSPDTSDLMGKLQSVLSDEESMKQIRELADMLSGGGSQSSAPQKENTLPDLSGLLGGGKSDEKETAAPADADITKIMQIVNMVRQSGQSDKNIDLLLALKPLLKEESRGKVDRLVKIFRLLNLYPVLKDSGLLGGDLFGII
jgi:hypothetical protein